ncbi:unnamed protein product, partial [Adineta ricciae]
MPTGHEFSQKVKQLMFHVIDFVESEKNGSIIPLYNVKDRLVKMLNISERSVYRLTHELHHSRYKEINKISQERKEMEEKSKEETSVKSLRSRTIVYSTLKRQQYSTSNTPAKILCRRHTASSAYPSTNHIDHLVPQALFPEKKLGFVYQRTSKIKIALDSQAFVAARAKYFQILDEFREDNVHLYYHNETWINLREVKRSIWTLNGEGEIKKGSRLAVSAIIDVNGYHIPSVDIWTCTEDHNMDSSHFLM